MHMKQKLLITGTVLLSAVLLVSAGSASAARKTKTPVAAAAAPVVVVAPPTLPQEAAPHVNIYSLTNHLTPLQSNTFLKLAALLGFVGFLLVQQTLLLRMYAWFMRALAERTGPGVRARSNA